MNTLYRLLGLFCLLLPASLLAAGCGSKKEAATAKARKTFVGAQSINEVPLQYRKMQRP